MNNDKTALQINFEFKKSGLYILTGIVIGYVIAKVSSKKEK